YGLGAQAMMGGSTKAPLACLAWPTGEFGGMGLEGYVRLGYRKVLEAAGSPEEEEQLFRQLVDRLYEHGKALSIATWFEIDDVIDPADTRRWLSTLLRSVPPQDRTSPTRPPVDTW
ncbi:MAG: biotin carboxylase, partial [Actinomycetota bacterium]|nr:biotin carboxylase [Actinomycetota bacterium]